GHEPAWNLRQISEGRLDDGKVERRRQPRSLALLKSLFGRCPVVEAAEGFGPGDGSRVEVDDRLVLEAKGAPFDAGLDLAHSGRRPFPAAHSPPDTGSRE